MEVWRLVGGVWFAAACVVLLVWNMSKHGVRRRAVNRFRIHGGSHMLIIHSNFVDQLLIVKPIAVGDGIDDDAVFRAANRIDDCDTDCDRLRWGWQRLVRQRLDRLALPSMSATDAYVLVSPQLQIVRRRRVLPVGWDDLPELEAEALLQRAMGELAVREVPSS